ncbi:MULTISPECIES: hypothetical protein [Streptomyces]|uniref:Uncharacterized protein n=1 Tax=Streptomyces virginiae TaxID=1961 RepID=A0ABZ1TQ86_STRVG|nr:hypothetical protein [Streptomyces virginiae]WTB27182.1 hypothetical protein OG253_40180 [Streptomyces virginiae]
MVKHLRRCCTPFERDRSRRIGHAVDRLTALQFCRHGNRVWRVGRPLPDVRLPRVPPAVTTAMNGGRQADTERRRTRVQPDATEPH